MKWTTISVTNSAGTCGLQNCRGLSVLVPLLLILCRPLFGAGVIVRFAPDSPDVGPFPTDALTIADAQQKTGRRMNLPLPDCQAQPSACQDVAAINDLDGFSIAPRIRARFASEIDPDTLSEGLFLVVLNNLTSEEYGLAWTGATIPLNQLIYDPETLSLYAKPDVVLEQHRRYALIVTSAVRDARGDAVGPDPDFVRCVNQRSNSYCDELTWLIEPIRIVAERFGGARRIVAASVFTTMSATTWMEAARDLLPSFPTATRLAGPRSVFNAQEVASIVWRGQNRISPPGFADTDLRADLLEGVGRIGFGSYRSPRFLNQQQLIPAVPTAVALEPPAQTEEIVFNAFIPASSKPASGYPVVIAPHSFGFGFAYYIAGAMATAGYATLTINAVGNGFGPEGRLLITEKNGTITDLPARGRSVDLNRDGAFGNGEGCGGLGSFGA